MLPSTLQELQHLPVLVEGESPSQDGGGRPVTDQSSVLGRAVFKQETYSARFEDIFIVGRDRMRGNYRISLSGNERLRTVSNFETPPLTLPILILQLAPTGRCSMDG